VNTLVPAFLVSLVFLGPILYYARLDVSPETPERTSEYAAL